MRDRVFTRKISDIYYSISSLHVVSISKLFGMGSLWSYLLADDTPMFPRPVSRAVKVKNVYDAFTDILQKKEMLRFCPTPYCVMGYEAGEGNGYPYECPACEKQICTKCCVAFHGGLTCERYQDSCARLMVKGGSLNEDITGENISSAQRWREHAAVLHQAKRYIALLGNEKKFYPDIKINRKDVEMKNRSLDTPVSLSSLKALYEDELLKDYCILEIRSDSGEPEELGK